MKLCYFAFDSVGSIFTPLLFDDALINAKDKGHDVHFVYCDSHLPACGINYLKSKVICFDCAFNRSILFNKYRSVTNLKFIPLSSLNIQKIVNKQDFFEFNSFDELSKKTYKGVNVGIGAISSFVSKTRNLYPEFNDTTKEVFKNFLLSGCMLVESVIELNRLYKYDEIRFANGRLLTERPIYETVKILNKPFNVLELSNSKEPFIFKKVLYGEFLPFDIVNYNNLINKFWESNINSQYLAHEFFSNRRSGIHASDKIYIKNQLPGKLPLDWDFNKRNFTIFNSSEDEFFSIGGLWDSGKLFKSQIDGIKHILNVTIRHKNIHLYLRIHPNLSGIQYKYVTELGKLSLDFNNLTIIAGNSDISTYSLIDNSEKIIVFGSTVGVEANYWKKPVISLSPSLYFFLDVTHFPNTLNELDYLLICELDLKPQIGSLKYALFTYGDFGESWKYINFNYRVFKFFGHNYLVSKYLNSFFIVYKIIFKIFRILSYVFFRKKERALLIEKN